MGPSLGSREQREGQRIRQALGDVEVRDLVGVSNEDDNVMKLPSSQSRKN